MASYDVASNIFQALGGGGGRGAQRGAGGDAQGQRVAVPPGGAGVHERCIRGIAGGIFRMCEGCIRGALGMYSNRVRDVYGVH
jgi:hypothetical protein